MTKKAERLARYKIDVLQLLYHAKDGIPIVGNLKWSGHGDILKEDVPRNRYLNPILYQLIYKDHCASIVNGRAYINEAGVKKLMNYNIQITECQLPLFI